MKFLFCERVTHGAGDISKAFCRGGMDLINAGMGQAATALTPLVRDRSEGQFACRGRKNLEMRTNGGTPEERSDLARILTQATAECDRHGGPIRPQ